jgi:hypothetical protein
MLTDNILNLIKQSDDVELIGAQKMIERIDDKDQWYRFVASKQFTSKAYDDISKITADKVSSYGSGNLRPEDIRIEINKFNFALGSKDPLEHVTFYNE